MEKLKHYRIDLDDIYYDENGNEIDPEFTICLEHPSIESRTLCGADISDTLDGQPIITNEKINCKYCLDTIKAIKELKDV